MRPSGTDTQEVEHAIASQEQAADLAVLQAAAGGGVQPVTGAAPDDDAIPEPSAAAMQVAQLAVSMMRPVIAYAVPALRSAPDALWEPVPGGVAGIMDHYGIGADAIKSPWARLALACAPLAAFAAMEAMKEQPSPKPEQAREPERLAPAQDAQGAGVVTFGAPAAE